jgi:hypothetical protein
MDERDEDHVSGCEKGVFPRRSTLQAEGLKNISGIEEKPDDRGFSQIIDVDHPKSAMKYHRK